MAKKKLTDIKSIETFLEKTAGAEAVEMVKIWQKNPTDFNDEDIAKKMGLKVTDVRTVLNRLHYRGISDYQKKRNKKTGWYSYTWCVNKKRIVELVTMEQEASLKKLEGIQKERQNYSYFSCPKGCGDVVFEVAAEYNFKCPECSTSMVSADDKKATGKITKQIRELKKEIDNLKAHVS